MEGGGWRIDWCSILHPPSSILHPPFPQVAKAALELDAVQADRIVECSQPGALVAEGSGAGGKVGPLA